MISNILVPTDFSEVAINATKVAADIAKRTGATVHVFHVKQIPVLDVQMPSETYQMYIDELEKASKEGLAITEAELLKPNAVSYTLNTATGFVYDEIIKYTRGQDIDLIVIGTTGASGLQEIFFGSNAASIVSKSEIPVLVIPPSVSSYDIKHILYSTDYTDPEFPAVTRLTFFAKLYAAKLTILHVKTDFDRYFNSANNFFARNKDHISLDDLTIVSIENEEITDAINRYIDEKGVDMVVVAKHNRTFFDRLFHRSLSKKLAYNTRVPLLVLQK
jgi:nucleotide-binding universal stress UspA family protein